MIFSLHLLYPVYLLSGLLYASKTFSSLLLLNDNHITWYVFTFLRYVFVKTYVLYITFLKNDINGWFSFAPLAVVRKNFFLNFIKFLKKVSSFKNWEIKFIRSFLVFYLLFLIYDETSCRIKKKSYLFEKWWCVVPPANFRASNSADASESRSQKNGACSLSLTARRRSLGLKHWCNIQTQFAIDPWRFLVSSAVVVEKGSSF